MKKIMYFKLPLCQYCIDANRWINEVMYEHPEYENIDIEVIDGSKQRRLASQYDYKLVPSFYIDGKKEHEGVATKALVKEIFKKAYQS